MSPEPSRRILITGLSSWWGGRLAQALEREPGVEAIVGIDTEDPRHELERTEFVRVDIKETFLRRIIVAAAIDTVLDTRLISDPLLASLDHVHRVNVEGTRNLLAACSGADSQVRKLVFKSSARYYGSSSDDPAFFSETLARTEPPQTRIERDIVAAEEAASEFAAARRGTTLTVVRCADVLGDDQRSSPLALLGLPVIPSLLGFDPRLQFIHEDDAIGALAHVTRHDLPGRYNAAADGVLALSEVASLLGKPVLPVLPPWGLGFAAGQLRRLGVRVPVELVRELRYGRGLDNRLLKASGFRYRYTTREAVIKLRARQRLRPLLRSGSESYRYEREVEEFLRWSPSVRTVRETARPAPDGDGDGGVDELGVTELIEIISSLEAPDLARLREYEAAHGAREAVLEALDRNLARRQSDNSDE
ncbi:MAG TPA: NAD-dependent epimerase/dehydratase family protein [Solirubrobacteraceae bacterium]|jgi:UDP-glucose 4-epimerase